VSLRQQAALDARRFLEAQDGGFGVPIRVRSPAGVEADLVGFSTDIGQTIDPETGQAVSGRRASVALPLAALADAGLAVPVHIPNAASRPWVVVFEDSLGVERSWKVQETMPDRALGVVVCFVELYAVEEE
jgi:hypothetical protein